MISETMNLDLVSTDELYHEICNRYSTAILMTSPAAGEINTDLCVFYPMGRKRNMLEVIGLLKLGPPLVTSAIAQEQEDDEDED